MEFDNIISWLGNHANLVDSPPEVLEKSFLYALWRANHPGSQLSFDEPLGDLMEALESANHVLNGALPSETVSVSPSISRRLSYCISRIICDGLSYSIVWRANSRFDLKILNRLDIALWRIACCYDAILAGDIDDLENHVEVEILTRGLPTYNGCSQ